MRPQAHETSPRKRSIAPIDVVIKNIYKYKPPHVRGFLESYSLNKITQTAFHSKLSHQPLNPCARPVFRPVGCPLSTPSSGLLHDAIGPKTALRHGLGLRLLRRLSDARDAERVRQNRASVRNVALVRLHAGTARTHHMEVKFTTCWYRGE